MNGLRKGLSGHGCVLGRIWPPPTSFARRNQIVSEGAGGGAISGRTLAPRPLEMAPRVGRRPSTGQARAGPRHPARYKPDNADNKAAPTARPNPSAPGPRLSPGRKEWIHGGRQCSRRTGLALPGPWLEKGSTGRGEREGERGIDCLSCLSTGRPPPCQAPVGRTARPPPPRPDSITHCRQDPLNLIPPTWPFSAARTCPFCAQG